MVLSSLDARSGSRNLGEGSRCGALSERERALGDFDFCGVVAGLRPGGASSRSPVGSSLLPPIMAEEVGVMRGIDGSRCCSVTNLACNGENRGERTYHGVVGGRRLLLVGSMTLMNERGSRLQVRVR